MMSTLLREDGHIPVDNPRHAELLLVNTCAFIADARMESLNTLRELARHKRRGQRLVAAGCITERDAAEVKRLVPQVDLFRARAWSRVRESLMIPELTRRHDKPTPPVGHFGNQSPQEGSSAT